MITWSLNQAPRRTVNFTELQGSALMKCTIRHLPGLLLLMACGLFAQVLAQGSNRAIFGDLKVDESNVAGLKPIRFDVILCSEA